MTVVLWPASQAKAIVNGKSYTIEVADTKAAREQGLGGRTSLPADAGMLFVFGQSDIQCFWMKDMHFNLDIIWLDARHRVVHIAQNVSPSTYPDSFCPARPAKYVLELNAGQAQQAGIEQGSLVDF